MNVTAVTVNYKTKILIEKAVNTFRAFYPNVKLIIFDNHSQDGSTEWIKARENELTTVRLLDSNIGHGPALHYGLLQAETQYVFAFDSDVEFTKGGFLEKMLETIVNKYAVGWLRHVNVDGVSTTSKDVSLYCPYIHPYAALFDKEIYVKLNPMQNLGAPCVFNMRDARDKGYQVASFPIEQYCKHLVAGTRRMWSGHWYPGEKQPSKTWNDKDHYPI